MEQHTLTGQRPVHVSQLALGAMMFGTTIDEPTSFAILDRFVEAGGTFIDTANCYQFWEADGTGEESELLLGRWLASRKIRDEVVIATKVGAGPTGSPRDWPKNKEGLSARVINDQINASLRRLGTDHVDLYYAHHEDRATPLEETVAAFAAVVAAGKTQLLGVCNHPAWRIAQARELATAAGIPGFSVIQQRHTYLQSKPGVDHAPMPPASDELLDYVRSEPEVSLIAYSPLLTGAYTGRRDRAIAAPYDHPGSTARLTVLREVAAELRATANQVVLAWLMATAPPAIPLFGASSRAQLDETLAATELKLDPEQLDRLDTAG